MINETMSYMFQLKGDDLKDMDIWNYTQPFYGKKMAFTFGMFIFIVGDLYYFSVITKQLPEMS